MNKKPEFPKQPTKTPKRILRLFDLLKKGKSAILLAEILRRPS
jgi:hypothetical protein